MTNPRHDRPDPSTHLPPLADEETDPEPEELTDELPPDEGGDLLDDSANGENLTPDELGIGDAAEDGWTDDSEGDEAGHADDVGDLGSEYGWTNELDEPGTDDWDEDLGSAFSEQSSVLDDTGEEGALEPEMLDHDFEPLESGEDDDETADGDDDLPGLHGDETTKLPPAHDETHVLLRPVGGIDAALVAITARGSQGLVAGGHGLWTAAPGGSLEEVPVEGTPLETDEVTSLAVDPGFPDRITVGTLLSGVLVSSDAGRTLRGANGWRASARHGSLGVWVAQAGKALLCRTGDGTVLTSGDHGAGWTRLELPGPALAHTTTEQGGLVLLCSTPQGPVLVRSLDAVTLEAGTPQPSLRAVCAMPDLQLAAGHDLVVIGAEDHRRGTWASTDGGRTFVLWEAAPSVTALAVHPTAPGTCALAVCLSGQRAAVLWTSDAGRTVTTLFELGTVRQLLHLEGEAHEDIEDRIGGLSFDPIDGALLVASSAGALLVRVRDDDTTGGR